MRPESIRQFEYFYLGSIGLAVANLLYQLSQLGTAYVGLGSLGGLEETAGGVPTMLLFVLITVASVLVAAAIPLALWYFAARKGSQVAKWLIVVLGGFGALRLLLILVMLGVLVISHAPTPDYVWVTMVLGFLTELLHMAAVAFLFPRDAREWFASRGMGTPVHEDIFS